MPCCACGELVGPFCPACRRSLVPAPDAVVRELLVRSAFLHEGAAKLLVQRLKYDGMTRVVPFLARAMAMRLPSDVDVLVPVPRSLGRRVRFGVDQSAILAEAVGALGGIPVARALRVPPFHRPNAGLRRGDRSSPTVFPARVALRGRALLVDDVVTTGATLGAARIALGGCVIGALTATRAPAHAVRCGGAAGR